MIDTFLFNQWESAFQSGPIVTIKTVYTRQNRKPNMLFFRNNHVLEGGRGLFTGALILCSLYMKKNCGDILPQADLATMKQISDKKYIYVYTIFFYCNCNFMVFFPEFFHSRMVSSSQIWILITKSICFRYVEKFEIHDLRSKLKYTFEINDWIAVDIDKVPELFVSPANVSLFFRKGNLFNYNLANGLRDTHYWTSILLK